MRSRRGKDIPGRQLQARIAFGCALMSLASSALSSQQPSDHPTLAIVGGYIVDPSTASPPYVGTILISGDRIVAIQRGEARPSGVKLVQARGRYIVAGLWDMHAHLATGDASPRAPENYVGNGVLGIRDMGGYLDALKGLRTEIANGNRIGPTMVIAGPTLNGEASAPFHRPVANGAEARAAVRELAAAGVDFIKIHRRTGVEAFSAIASEARLLGIPFAGHVPLALQWPEASAAGMKSIEHIQTLLENETAKGADSVDGAFRSLKRIEGDRGREIFEGLAAHGTFFTPTLVFFERSWQGDQRQRRELKQRLYARLRPLVAQAAATGVRILAGSDLSDRQGTALVDELDRLVRAGLSPRQALAAATINARIANGRGPGFIAVGEEASLLVLEADPTAKIGNLRRLTSVILRGRVLEAADLSALRR